MAHGELVIVPQRRMRAASGTQSSSVSRLEVQRCSASRWRPASCHARRLRTHGRAGHAACKPCDATVRLSKPRGSPPRRLGAGSVYHAYVARKRTWGVVTRADLSSPVESVVRPDSDLVFATDAPGG